MNTLYPENPVKRIPFLATVSACFSACLISWCSMNLMAGGKPGFCFSNPSTLRYRLRSHRTSRDSIGSSKRELASRGVNTLILRIDFHYHFKSHPELVDDGALSYEQVQSLVKTCRGLKIRLIPQVNLLGHQSWQENVGKLLAVYPEFDETPSIKLPTKHQWPNKEGLYCKSYCPMHPEVHQVVFACVDEICDAFQADAFHAGLDEVFFIGHPKCPRCAGKDRSALFADEVTRIHHHLAKSEREPLDLGRPVDRREDNGNRPVGKEAPTIPFVQSIRSRVTWSSVIGTTSAQAKRRSCSRPRASTS